MLFKNIFQSIFFLAFWLVPLCSKAQDTCVFLFSIAGNARFVTADHLLNTYLIHGFEVEKFDSTGRFVSRYSNNRLGVPAFLDASSPLKILVWYADFQTAVFLDRNLTELGRLNVAEAGWPAVRCLAATADGNFWAYDEATSQLLKLSASGEKLLESQPLHFVFSNSFSPVFLRDDDGQAIYLSDPTQGSAIFDAYGHLFSTMFFSRFTQIEVQNDVVFFVEKDGIYAEGVRAQGGHKIFYPPEVTKLEGKTIWISNRKIFVQTESGVAVYRF